MLSPRLQQHEVVLDVHKTQHELGNPTVSDSIPRPKYPQTLWVLIHGFKVVRDGFCPSRLVPTIAPRGFNGIGLLVRRLARQSWSWLRTNMEIMPLG